MVKKVLNNKSGTIMVFVLFMFASIMVVITALLALSRQNYNGVVTQQLNARAYYLTLETSDIAVAALLGSANNVNYETLLEEYYYNYSSSTTKDIINYEDNNKSVVKLVFEPDESLSNDNEKAYWAVIYITTSVNDYRVNIGYNNETLSEYKLYYQYKMLVVVKTSPETFISNTNKRVFGIITEDKT